MKIKMISLAAGPAGNKYPGKIYEVAEEEGRALVAGRHAIEIVEPEEKRQAAPEQETAVEKPPENTTAALRRRGR